MVCKVLKYNQLSFDQRTLFDLVVMRVHQENTMKNTTRVIRLDGVFLDGGHTPKGKKS